MRYSHYFFCIVALFTPAAAQTPTQGANAANPIAQIASACDAGTGSACYELGEKLRFGFDVGKDEPRARRLHERGCSLNEARSCFRLGTMTVRGEGGARDSAGARAAYEKSCRLNDSDGCSSIGAIYSLGVGVPIDMNRAAVAYQKACRLNPGSTYICTKARETAAYLPNVAPAQERPQIAQNSAPTARPATVSTATASAPTLDGTQCRAAASVILRYGAKSLAALSNIAALRPSAENSQRVAAKEAEIARANKVSTKYAAARAPNAQELAAMETMPGNQITSLLQRCSDVPQTLTSTAVNASSQSVLAAPTSTPRPPVPSASATQGSAPNGTQCRAAASVILPYSARMTAILEETTRDKSSLSYLADLSEFNGYAARGRIVGQQYAAARAPNAQELAAMESMPIVQIFGLLERCRTASLAASSTVPGAPPPRTAPKAAKAAATARPNAPPVITNSPLPRSSQTSPPNLAAHSPTTTGASKTNSVGTGQAAPVTPRSCTVNATQAISFYRTLIPIVERQVLDGVSPAFRADARTRLVGYRENLALAQDIVRAYPSTSPPTEAENNAAKDMVLGARRRILEQCAIQRRVTWESSNSPNTQSTQVVRPNGSAPSVNAQLSEGLRVLDMTASDTLVGTSRVKYFEFQAQPMMGVNITATAPSGSASFLTIERAMPDGQWLIVLTQNMPDGLIGTILESGRHRLVVSASNRATGRFDLAVRTTEPARNVPPLQRTQTGQITNASFRSGTVTGQAYKTAAKAGQIFEFQAAAIGFEVELLAIMSDAPEQSSGNLQRTVTLRYVAPKDGTLLINVVTRIGQTGRYTLTASAQAAPMPPPVSATSSVPRPPAQTPPTRASTAAPPPPVSAPDLAAQIVSQADSLRRTQPEQARRLYKVACDGRSIAGCYWQGWMLDNGRGGPSDRPTAQRLITNACNSNFGQACAYLGSAYEYGSGVETNETTARGFYQKACTLNYAGGCLDLALLQLDGRGGPKDERASRANLERACTGGDRVGCSTLAGIRTSGKGGSVDLPGAATAKRRACEFGLTSACTN